MLTEIDGLQTYYTFDGNDCILTELTRDEWKALSWDRSRMPMARATGHSADPEDRPPRRFGSANSITDYVYDLQGRLDQVKVDNGGNGTFEQITPTTLTQPASAKR
ncbi:MAG: hypothetical protein U1D30_08655 [Planctomycetota bacterium]